MERVKQKASLSSEAEGQASYFAIVSAYPSPPCELNPISDKRKVYQRHLSQFNLTEGGG